MEENEGKEKKQKKKMQPKRWLAGFLGIFLAGLAGCIALVIWVDPFFQYHKPLAWFPYLVDNQVNQNPGLAKHMDYDGILIGSSMTASFNTDWFEELMGMKTQKLSYNGSYPKDLSNIMQLYLTQRAIRSRLCTWRWISPHFQQIRRKPSFRLRIICMMITCSMMFHIC